MYFNNWPRHQLRAQGRLDRHLESEIFSDQEQDPADDADRPFGKRPRDSVSRATQLLNFLSKSTAQNERSILSPHTVPDFARVKIASADQDEEIQLLLNVKRRPSRKLSSVAKAAARKPSPGPVVDRFQCESLLGLLADTLAEQASLTSPFYPNRLSPKSTSLTAALVGDATAELAAAQQANERQLGNPALSEAYSGCMADLDRWLSTESDVPALDPTLFLSPLPAQSDFEPDLQGAGTLPAALPALIPASDLTNDEGFIEERLRSQPCQDSPDMRERTGLHQNSRYKRFLFNKNVRYKPRLLSMANGNRLERFTNGAELIKDAHGRVLEIRTVHGTNIQVHYDREGKPDSFIRLCPRYQAHSLGEQDKHGVVVRDVQGRVRAQGESMAIDPTGCVSIRRSDGQFWSLDLVRGVHIERRAVNDSNGGTNILTALFAADGFRMATRFQNAPETTPTGEHKQWLSDAVCGMFRFYGRDGSMVQFASEDDLLELKPARVWQPGSRTVNSSWRGFHQAGTAWESVQEYITNYLLA